MQECSDKVRDLLDQIYGAVDRGETTLEEMLNVVMDSFANEIKDGDGMSDFKKYKAKRMKEDPDFPQTYEQDYEKFKAKVEVDKPE